MKLELNMLDVQPALPPRMSLMDIMDVEFRHLQPKVQQALIIVGRAVIRDGDLHKAIYPPEGWTL